MTPEQRSEVLVSSTMARIQRDWTEGDAALVGLVVAALMTVDDGPAQRALVETLIHRRVLQQLEPPTVISAMGPLGEAFTVGSARYYVDLVGGIR